eukprot:TRINITY_DN17806_c0_g1_i1.p1 TRINITY_DN17806_c0_g1~~TRINITY_DN17806_c0_g1_i1.p1  ORF type:complete len:110 (+),score=2.64 TRINITY_DN17806_c0_g1_i1:169-498(+)
MGRAFTLMHKHGILAAYLPQWRNIFGQMQFDLFHAYTVDEHTHKLIQNIYHYSQPECSDNISNFVVKYSPAWINPSCFILLVIFHDIAKGVVAIIPNLGLSMPSRLPNS